MVCVAFGRMRLPVQESIEATLRATQTGPRPTWDRLAGQCVHRVGDPQGCKRQTCFI